MSVPLERLEVSAYTVPTDGPESDGTFEWESTTIVVVQATADGKTGLGCTYADVAAALLIAGSLARALEHLDVFAIPAAWNAMWRAVRNVGRPGIAAMAISAVDLALHDLKARLLGLPLVDLLGACRDGIAAYGSGGFTSYTVERLQAQLAGWVEQGMSMVKMKVGRDPEGADLPRVQAAKRAIGPALLFVDANGAYSRKQALSLAGAYAEQHVAWFEEPVSSDDLDGLRLIRDRAPDDMAITAGEYGFEWSYFRRMLDAGAVDVQMADVTRCGGITGLAGVDVLCRSRSLEMSAHCAPAWTVHAACALPSMRHIEYFHDHVRLERMLFDGVLQPRDGKLWPDRSRPGNGLALKASDAARYQVFATSV